MAVAILLAGLSMTLSLALNLDPPGEPLRGYLHGILAAITGLGLIFRGWPVLRGAWVPRLTLQPLYLIGLGGGYAASLYASWTGIGHIYYEVVLILLTIHAMRDGRDRELDRLLAACRAADPSPTGHLAQRVLARFVPAVLAVALGTWAYWAWIANDPSAAWFNALAVTIVACPCALGLAVPLASRLALLQLRTAGLLPHQPDVIERLATVDTVAFDKTGTLSHPKLGLETLETRPGAPAALAGWIAAIQRTSSHPVARPFWSLTEPAELAMLEVRALPACGIEAHFDVQGKSHHLRIGNNRVLPEGGHDATPDVARRLYVILDGKWVATAHLAEKPREAALAALRAFRSMGFQPILLTGDTACPADYREGWTCTPR